MREIITIQLGSQANYLGTHFWNTQESYFTYGQDQDESPVDHDVHFRPGKAADGSDTYTPRAIVYDFKQNFGTLRALNELYDTVELSGGDYASQSLWGGTTSQQRNAPIEMSEYQRSLASGLEPRPVTSDRVRFWSDYNRVFMNPKSMVQIYETELNPGQTAFEDWAAGQELFKSLDRDEDVFDQNVRAFVEEADQLQGLQLFTSADDGWAGFTAQFLERMRDEMGKLPVWTWTSSRSARGISAITAARRATTQARSLVEVAQQASIYVPMITNPSHTLSWLSVEADSPWSTAALQLAALETASLPSRLRAAPGASATLDEIGAGLHRPGERRIIELAFEARPGDGSTGQLNGATSDTRFQAGSGTASRQDKLNNRPLCDLSPYGDQGASSTSDEQVFAEVQSSRGHTFDETDAGERSAVAIPSGLSSETRISSYSTNLSFPMLDSYPQLFNFGQSQETRLEKVGMRSRLQTSSRTCAWAKSLATQTQRFFDPEEREEMLNSLGEIADSYAAGYGSDEDWD